MGAIEIDIIKGYMLLLVRFLLVYQVLHNTALEQMLGNDFVHILGTNAAVKCALRINNYNWAGFAKAKAAGTNNLNFPVQTVAFDLLFKALNQLGGAAGRTAGTATDKHMCAKKIHVCSSLAFLFAFRGANGVFQNRATVHNMLGHNA